MTVFDLSRDQLTELKCDWYAQMLDKAYNAEPSYLEFALIDNLVGDTTIMCAYADYSFTNDDFFCSVER